MSKKFIPIIIGALVVVAIVVIAIVGTNPDLTNKEIYVQNIIITTEKYDSFEENGTLVSRFMMTNDNTSLVDGKKTFKLDYTITPSNATYKTVNFISSNTSIATVDQNGLVTFLKEDSVLITLEAKDSSQKKAYAQLVWPTVNESSLNVSIDNLGELQFGNVGDSINLSKVEDDILYLYDRVEYSLISDGIVDISETDVAGLKNNVLETYSTGSFSLTFNFNGVEKTQNVEVVEYVNTFMTGISYSEYLETIGNLNNQSISANFLNKTAQKYQVGVDNSYHFDFIIQNGNNENISLANAELIYVTYEVIDGQKELIENAEVFSINSNGTLKFLSENVGKEYEVQVLPKYNFLNKDAVTFNFVLVEGVNIFSHEELKENFSNLDITNFIIHSNIVAKVNNNQLDPYGRVINFSNLTSNNGITGDIYTRLYTEDEIDFSIGAEVNVYGNYFKIDGTKLPYLTVQDGGSGYSSHDPLSWTQSSGYPCASIQTAIFKVQENTQDAYDNGVEKENPVNFNLYNLKVEGNTSTGILYDTDDDGNVIIPEDEAINIANQGSSHAGIMGRGAVQVNTNNVVVLRTNIGLYATGVCGGVNLDNTLINDSWGNGILGWRTSNVELRDSTIRRAGGAAICITDASITDAYSPEWMDATLTFGPNVILDNYVSGTEGYFIVNGLSQIVPSLKGTLNTKIEALGKTVVKDEIIEETEYEMFNFAIQFGREKNYVSLNKTITNVGSEDGWETYVSGTYLVRSGNFLVNKYNPDEKYDINGTNCVVNKTVDSQIVINYYDGMQNEVEKYITIERKSGYYNNAITTALGNTYLGGVSEISDVEDLLLTTGLVGGYLTASDFVTDITQDNGTSEIATFLNGDSTIINTVNSALQGNYTPIKQVIKNKISALAGGNLTNGLNVFSQLSDQEKIVYLCDYTLYNTIKTNVELYRLLLQNPALKDYYTSINALLTGVEKIKQSAKTNSNLLLVSVAVTLTNDLIELKEGESEKLNLIEAKINSDALGDFSGILIFAGLYSITA